MLGTLGRLLRLARPSQGALGPDPVAAAKRRLGARGEREAERHLRRHGYRVLARNFVAPVGEVDLICRDPDGFTVVLVEVKSRSVEPGVVQPPPEAQITAAKQRTLRSLASHLSRANGWARSGLRIDVVAVEFEAGRTAMVRHHPGAVDLRAAS